MIVFPNAKINIGLKVVGKRVDGFHDLESIFYPINWCDVLEINPDKKFQFYSTGLKINGSLESNLVVKAFKIIQKNYDIPNVNIHLHKQIPMGAGLGGGSSDGSFTLTALNQLFNLNIPILDLEKMADSLGSDCPFFIENTPKFVSGKGNKMMPSNLDLSGFYIKLINPNIHISTANAFKGIRFNSTTNELNHLNLSDFIANPLIITNDFEETIFIAYPKLNGIKNKLLKEGAFYASMTGTGSTIYGLFKEKPETTFDSFTEKIIRL